MKDPMDDEFQLGSNPLYVSFDAFKTLLDAGIPRNEALSRTGLSEEDARELEIEEESEEFKGEFTEEWDMGGDEDGDDSFGEFGDEEDEFGGGDDFNDFGNGGGYDD